MPIFRSLAISLLLTPRLLNSIILSLFAISSGKSAAISSAFTAGDFEAVDFEVVDFEEDDFDAFIERLKEYDVEYVHPVKTHSWGQRVVRIYDPDKHIIEIGENLKVVCKRFLDSGMTAKQVAEKMDVPIKFVNSLIKN